MLYRNKYRINICFTCSIIDKLLCLLVLKMGRFIYSSERPQKNSFTEDIFISKKWYTLNKYNSKPLRISKGNIYVCNNIQTLYLFNSFRFLGV